MEERMSTYAFIDGRYIRKLAEEFMQQMFGVPAELDFGRMRLGDRIYYYDCLDDEKKPSESEEDFKKRLDEQIAEFNAIQSLPRFHVRYGSLTGEKRKRRQKKVDVQLAVDALEHAFRHNMSHVTLVTGDLDFAPLVECLIRVGTQVTVMYERTSAAPDLYRAADVSTEISVSMVWAWSSQTFQQSHSLPKVWSGSAYLSNPPYVVERVGSVGGKEALLHRTHVQPEHFVLEVKESQGGSSSYVQSADLQAIEVYMKLTYSPVSWTGAVANPGLG
jgi:uncharacterized LabA/DUF88 family protein